MASETKKEFSSDVVNFSSEYGINQSYTARNLAGPTRIWTKYGDFVDAFVLVRAIAIDNIKHEQEKPLTKPNNLYSESLLCLYPQVVLS